MPDRMNTAVLVPKAGLRCSIVNKHCQHDREMKARLDKSPEIAHSAFAEVRPHLATDRYRDDTKLGADDLAPTQAGAHGSRKTSSECL